MFENINWDGVISSIVDTWLPLLAIIALIVIAVIVGRFINKRKK